MASVNVLRMNESITGKGAFTVKIIYFQWQVEMKFMAFYLITFIFVHIQMQG